MGILLALSLGLAVFGYFAVNDLLAYENTPQQDTPGTLTYQPPAQTPTTAGQSLGQELIESLTRGPTLPLDHDPAHLPPFPGAVLKNRDLVPDPSIAHERATYEVSDTHVAQVVQHYIDACAQHGFTLVNQQDTPQTAGGLLLIYRKEAQQQLAVAIYPQGPPATPPMSPPKIIIALEFRYPISPGHP